jgi:hypothetical protein
MAKFTPRRGLLAATAIVVVGTLSFWLFFRKQPLLPEEALVQPQSAAFLVYTAATDDPLFDGDGGPAGASILRLPAQRLRQIKELLPLRVLAVLGPVRGQDRPLTVAVSLTRAIPLTQWYVAQTAQLVETYRGQSIRAPIGAKGYLAQVANRLLWSSERRELRGAIDSLTSGQPPTLPQRFSDLRSSDFSPAGSGAFYLFNDGQPFTIVSADGGATRLRLPAGFVGLSFYFDLAGADALSGRGRLRFRDRAAAAAQLPTIRALLDAAASQVGGRLSYQIESAGAADLNLTLRCSGLRQELSRALSGAALALKPTGARAATSHTQEHQGSGAEH